MKNGPAINDLLKFLSRLKKEKIFFKLSNPRHNAIMVEIVVPGERWEVEFMADGSVEVEIFRSDGQIQGKRALRDLFAKYSEPNPNKSKK